MPGDSPAGEWLFTVTFEGQTLVHKFYVDASPAPAPTMPESNNAYNGSWYDPTRDGDGFNLIVTPIGVVIYYYGFDNLGNRLWFISDVIAATLQAGQKVNSDLYKATSGTFSDPVPSDQALSKWGTVSIDVVICGNIIVTSNTAEGLKISNTIKIVSVVG